MDSPFLSIELNVEMLHAQKNKVLNDFLEKSDIIFLSYLLDLNNNNIQKGQLSPLNR